MSKKKQTRVKATIEDIYQNKVFVPPKEQNLETIFEEPRQSKDGVPILTSVKKYKRYLHFDPTQNKIHKRKKQAKKCLNKLKTNYRITRSSPENAKSDDIAMYILGVLGDTSSDSDTMDSNPTDKTKVFLNSDKSAVEIHPTSTDREVSCSDFCDTPKRNRVIQRSCHFETEDDVNTTVVRSESSEGEGASFESQKSSTVSDDEALESSRRSCCVS